MHPIERSMRTLTGHEAVKHDRGKSEYHLIPPEALEAVGAILALGAEKYEPHNWRKGMKWSRLFNASQRHVWAFWEGQDFDEESGQLHLAHAVCTLMFLLSYQMQENGRDDRFQSGGPQEEIGGQE